MLYVLERRESPIVAAPTAAAGVVRLARFHGQFLRTLRDVEPTGDTPERQLRVLAAALLERWPVPHWLDAAWLHEDRRMHQWFAHLGAGRNLADAPDLPYALTRRMAHFAVGAPRPMDPLQALRWGQVRGLDIPEDLCREVVHTRLSTTLPDEPFWRSVAHWFARHPEVYGHATAIVDFLFAQRVGDFARPPHPGFSMRGREPDRLLADARRWHDALNRRRRLGAEVPDRWPACGIAGFRPTPGGEASAATDGTAEPSASPPNWVIVELLTRDELVSEGSRLRHCVATYAPAAASGRSAMFSLRRLTDGELRPRVTIETWPAQRLIVQARGLQNAYAHDDDRRLIESWATTVKLRIEPFVFGTAPDRRRQ